MMMLLECVSERHLNLSSLRWRICVQRRQGHRTSGTRAQHTFPICSRFSVGWLCLWSLVVLLFDTWRHLHTAQQRYADADESVFVHFAAAATRRYTRRLRITRRTFVRMTNGHAVDRAYKNTHTHNGKRFSSNYGVHLIYPPLSGSLVQRPAGGSRRGGGCTACRCPPTGHYRVFEIANEQRTQRSDNA